MTVGTTMSFRARRTLIALLTAVIVSLGWSSSALAHTDFDSSTPSDEQNVDGPLETVTVRFTNPAKSSGEGFELLDADGVVRAPSAIDPTDGTSFVLTFEPPLEAGTYGVRWKVQAGDAHPIDGSFRFVVTTEAPTTAPPVSDPEADTGVAPASTTPAAVTVDELDPPAPVELEIGSAVATPAPTEALDEFLSSGDSGDEGAAALGRVGRILTFIGTIFGVGALAALVWVIRGHRDELRNLVAWVRLAGVAIAVGGVVELAALQAVQATGVADLVDTKAGLAALVKFVGGALIWAGFHERAGRVTGPVHSLSAAVATDLGHAIELRGRNTTPADDHRWSPSSSAAVGLVGYAVVLTSFWLDGHTVSKGPWALHSLVNLVHLGAAAVWGGGVFAMTCVAWLRRRLSTPIGMTAMVVRFSTIATYSLIAVIAAGLTMAALILESAGDMITTEWGRILLTKTLAVAIVAGIGGYNHLTLRPALERSPDDPALARTLRVSLTIESIVFVVVVVLTAWLVAAAT